MQSVKEHLPDKNTVILFEEISAVRNRFICDQVILLCEFYFSE